MHKNQAKSTTQYERRRPERTALYRVVQKHMETFFDHVDSQEGPGLPRFVRKEFEAFLGCGILPHGFVRIRCDECRSEKLVAFSCKWRGFCASCAGKRMAQTSAHWLDRLGRHTGHSARTGSPMGLVTANPVAIFVGGHAAPDLAYSRDCAPSAVDVSLP